MAETFPGACTSSPETNSIAVVLSCSRRDPVASVVWSPADGTL
ncbi:hypothetical protein [Nocardia africana]|nr:hypothetical protein [Nocardia africana]